MSLADDTKPVISHYKLLDLIGTGSFSTVFKAEDLLTHKIYAMKVFPKSNLIEKGDQERFQREVNAMAYIKHDNLIGLYDFFPDETNFYMVIDYCSVKSVKMTIILSPTN